MVFERPEPEMGTEGDVILKRIVAIIIDSILLFVVGAIIGGVLGAVSDVFGLLAGLINLVIFFGYFIYFEGESGQTVGKRVMDLVVVTEDGDPIDYAAAAIRTVLRIVDVLPVLYLVGFIVVLVTDRKQRLGDIAADTVVVRTAG